jgi:molybdate transport system substrate-binding protein
MGLAACGVKKRADHLTLFAASSLHGVIEEIVSSFERQNNIKVRINFASSGTLARQIENGAGADMLISANVDWVDHLEKIGLVKSWEDIAWNQLVLITFAGSRFEYQDVLELVPGMLADAEKIAIGAPETVPAGRYARQALQSLGVYENLMPYFLLSKDVSTALRYVELKEAVVGIVYYTDAVRSDLVVPKLTFPADTHAPIVYRAAVTGNEQRAGVFMEHLQCPATVEILEKHGFTVRK